MLLSGDGQVHTWPLSMSMFVIDSRSVFLINVYKLSIICVAQKKMRVEVSCCGNVCKTADIVVMLHNLCTVPFLVPYRYRLPVISKVYETDRNQCTHFTSLSHQLSFIDNNDVVILNAGSTRFCGQVPSTIRPPSMRSPPLLHS